MNTNSLEVAFPFIIKGMTYPNQILILHLALTYLAFQKLRYYNLWLDSSMSLPRGLALIN